MTGYESSLNYVKVRWGSLGGPGLIVGGDGARRKQIAREKKATGDSPGFARSSSWKGLEKQYLTWYFPVDRRPRLFHTVNSRVLDGVEIECRYSPALTLGARSTSSVLHGGLDRSR
jgi:hypothetical protein